TANRIKAPNNRSSATFTVVFHYGTAEIEFGSVVVGNNQLSAISVKTFVGNQLVPEFLKGDTIDDNNFLFCEFLFCHFISPIFSRYRVSGYLIRQRMPTAATSLGILP